MPAPREILFVTSNINKLREVQMLLATKEPEPKYVIHNKNLDLEELQGIDLEAIALAKCKQAVSILGTGHPVFVEDTALVFEEMNGLPGAYIKWFLKQMGIDKIVQMLDNFESKNAQAITTIAYADEKGEFHVFQGITDGKIVSKRGDPTFGWDPIFEPNDGKGLTYAEMDKDSKNLISHRGKAFAKFREYLNSVY